MRQRESLFPLALSPSPIVFSFDLCLSFVRLFLFFYEPQTKNTPENPPATQAIQTMDNTRFCWLLNVPNFSIINFCVFATEFEHKSTRLVSKSTRNRSTRERERVRIGVKRLFILLIFAYTNFPDNLKAVFRDCLISNQREWNSFDSSMLFS